MGNFHTINPATGQKLSEYSYQSSEEINQTIDQCHQSWKEWKKTSFPDRAHLMNNLSSLLADQKEELGKLITMEVGKPLSQSIAEIEKCAWVCTYYADNAEKFLKDEPILTEATKSFISYQPLGIVLAIMPWNFPFWQVFRFAAPGLMAGNAALLIRFFTSFNIT